MHVTPNGSKQGWFIDLLPDLNNSAIRLEERAVQCKLPHDRIRREQATGRHAANRKGGSRGTAASVHYPGAGPAAQRLAFTVPLPRARASLGAWTAQRPRPPTDRAHRPRPPTAPTRAREVRGSPTDPRHAAPPPPADLWSARPPAGSVLSTAVACPTVFSSDPEPPPSSARALWWRSRARRVRRRRLRLLTTGCI